MHHADCLSDADEAAIIGRLRAGAAAADDWSRLVRAYQDRVFAVCLRMVANRDVAADLCQDTLVRVVQSIGTFDGQSRFSTWVIRIAMNAALSHLRAAKVRKRVSRLDTQGHQFPETRGIGSSGSTEPRIGEHDPASSVQLGETRELLSRALALIEPDQRAILVLRDVQGQDYEQIAATLDIASGTVKSRLFRARLALRESLESLTRPEPHS
jgi:RNA polymerase sigma-70 factor (ECF subfamily)